MSRQQGGPTVSRPQVAFGAVVGAAAFVVNYLIAFVLWSATSFPDTLGGVVREFITNQVADWVFAGWLLYGGHLVSIDLPDLVGGPQNAIDLVGQTTATLLYVTVPLVLVAGGIALARSHGVSDLGDGAVTGGFAALGYFPLAAIGVFLFASAGDVTAQPAFAAGLLLAGLVYPVLFGAIGGVVATVIDQ